MNRQSWDEYFMGLCVEIAKRSKDRSTKVGAIIVGPDKEVRSTGYNGMPRGVNDEVEDRHERPKKYLYAEHAERNAIFNAARAGISTKGCTLYVTSIPEPLPICSDCARAIIQAGITQVIVGSLTAPERWKDSVEAAKEMFHESGVIVRFMNESMVAVNERERAEMEKANENRTIG